MSALDAQLLAAHAARDSVALVDLYARAARTANAAEQAAFYLTHAHVYAMETNHPDTAALRAELVAAGRESPLLPFNPPRR